MSKVLLAFVVGLSGLSLIVAACSDNCVCPSLEDATMERLTANWWRWLPTFPIVLDRLGWSRYSEEGDLTVVISDLGHVSCYGYTYTYEGNGKMIRSYGVVDTVYIDIFQVHDENFQRMNVYADAARDSFLETYFEVPDSLVPVDECPLSSSPAPKRVP